MPYQNGSADGPNDFLQKIVAWLSSLGWTVNSSVQNGTGWRAHLAKNGMFVNLCTTIGNVNPWVHSLNPVMPTTAAAVHLYCGDGYNASAIWNAQPGGPIGNGQTYTIGNSARLRQGADISYGFYSDNEDNVCIVLEGLPDIISSIGWGRLSKVGSYNGGEYFFGPLTGYVVGTTGTNTAGITMHAYCPAAFGGGTSSASNGARPAAFVRADVDSFTGKWLAVGTETSAQYSTGKNALSSVVGGNDTATSIASYIGLQLRTVTQATMAVTLLPVMLWAARDNGGSSPIGTVPGIYANNAASDTQAGPVTPGTVIKYGADDYVLYPNFAVKRVP